MQQGRVKWEYYTNFQRIYFSSTSGNTYTIKFYLQNITKRRIKYKETVKRGKGLFLET